MNSFPVELKGLGVINLKKPVRDCPGLISTRGSGLNPPNRHRFRGNGIGSRGVAIRDPGVNILMLSQDSNSELSVLARTAITQTTNGVPLHGQQR